MNQQYITIITNLKVVGWVTILSCAFGLVSVLQALVLYFSFYQSELLSVIGEPDVPDELDLLNYYILGAGMLCIFGVFIGRGILKLRMWAVNIFQIITALIALGILIWITVVYLNFMEEVNEISHSLMQSTLLTNGVAGLLLCWLLIRVNLLLLKKEYRAELR